jgi:hypothetical protein
MLRRAFCMGMSASALAVTVAGAGAGAGERRLSGGGLFPQTPREKAAGITPLNTSFAPGNVCRYGADPTGTNDSTAAFNAATFHDLDYSLEGLLNEIVVPAGTFRLDGTVYVRKGQRLRGAYAATRINCNNAGRGPTFKLGWGLHGKQETPDPGGQPLSLESLFLLGGPAAGCIDCTQVAGAMLGDLFISASALAVRIADSADLNVQNVIFDQGLMAINIVRSANCQFSLLKFYVMNYDVSVGAGVADCQWSNCHSEYNRYSAILFGEGADGIRNLKFTDWQFVYNPTSRDHYTSFAGAIHNRAPEVDARFDTCTFSNMPGYAYVHGTATGSRLEFANCVFDGNRTRLAYSRSTAAGALATQDEVLTLNACSFRNLSVTPVRVSGAAPTVLEINEGEYSRNDGASFIDVSNRSSDSRVRVTGLRGDAAQSLLNNQSLVPVTVRNCSDWFGPVRSVGARRYVLVPYQQSSVYRIMLRTDVFVVRTPTIDGGRPVIDLQNATDRAGNLGEAVALQAQSLAVSWSGGSPAERLDVEML